VVRIDQCGSHCCLAFSISGELNQINCLVPSSHGLLDYQISNWCTPHEPFVQLKKPEYACDGD